MALTGCVAVVPFSPHYGDGQLFHAATSLDRDGALAPWRELRKVLADEGWRIDTEDRLSGLLPDVWIHLDAFSPLSRRADPRRTIVMIFEPEVVAPYWYRRRDLEGYACVFTHRLDWVDRGLPFRYLFWPQTFRLATHTTERPEFLVMINGRKYPASRRGELYTERERVAAWFSRHSEISIFGGGWDQTSLAHPVSALRTPALARAYRGSVGRKADVLERSRFVLCFENMRSPGFRTEKLFDALASGAIAVYLGDPQITDAVPREAFIDYGELRSPTQLDRLLRTMGPEEAQTIRTRGWEFLSSDAFQPYTIGAFVRRLVDAVKEVAGR